MKLLTVSKSFIAGKNQPGRYKLAEVGALPKFAPVGRPVSLAPSSESKERAPSKVAASHSKEEFVSVPNEIDPRASLSLRQSCERHSPFAPPDADPNAATSKPSSSTVCANAIPNPANWFRLRNPFAGDTRRAPGADVPVQAELALNAVKPVRNDLTDADFEIVMTNRTTKRDFPAESSAGPIEVESTGLAWSRLSARMFKGERARA